MEEMLYLMTHSTHFIYIYCIGHMVKDHSDSEIGILLLPHGLLIPISSQGYFICTIPQTGWVHHEGSIRRSIAPWTNALTTELHLTPVPAWSMVRLRWSIADFDFSLFSVFPGRKEVNVLFNDALNTFYFMVIWRQTYVKGPLR